MTLPAPKLDSRTFDDLMREARDRIPRYTPEYTNFNATDPGMTLVELQAWMSETILYELNRVPDLNYMKFLDLLGITPRPAHPARADIELTLDRLDSPSDVLVVPVPKSTPFSVDDPDLGGNLTFESDRSVLALNAAIGMVLIPNDDGEITRQMIAPYDDATVWQHAFHPFGTPAGVGNSIYVGLVLRPQLSEPLSDYINDKLPHGPLNLFFEASQVLDQNAQGAMIAGPNATSCATDGITGPEIEWEIYTGVARPTAFDDGNPTGWSRLYTSLDETDGLARTGLVTLEIPQHAVPVGPQDLPADFWTSFGGLKPPVTLTELQKVLFMMADPTDLADAWEVMGLVDPTLLDEIAACGTDAAAIADKLTNLAAQAALDDTVVLPDPKRLTQAQWVDLDPAFAISAPLADDRLRPLYWLRATYKSAGSEGARPVAELQSIRLNTAHATQAATHKEERLGVSNGGPSQAFSLSKTPVLIDPDTGAAALELLVGGEADWTPVADFYASGPNSAHYMLDPVAGAITFGDGLRGRIPVANAPIVAIQYRSGGGAIGNVGRGTITKLKGKVKGIKSANNPRAAHDGSDAETLETVKLRAPHELRHRDRAVTAEDFSDLALRTPGVALHRATALARSALHNGIITPRNGSVTVVVLPVSDAAQPQPSEAQLDAVCHWLVPRRLLGTELHVTGPTYAQITGLGMDISVSDDADFGQVSDAIYGALTRFIHPITGGKSGMGWDFGAALYHADIYDQVLSVSGVVRASRLSISVAGGTQDIRADITTIPQGALPSLTRDKIELVLRYG